MNKTYASRLTDDYYDSGSRSLCYSQPFMEQSIETAS